VNSFELNLQLLVPVSSVGATSIPVISIAKLFIKSMDGYEIGKTRALRWLSLLKTAGCVNDVHSQ
jgi:hypothetical protein